MKQKNKNVSIENYQENAMSTCLPSCKNEKYAYYGYLSEAYELESKLYGRDAKKIRGDSEEKLAELTESIKDEIGDCFWFIALRCELCKWSFKEIYNLKYREEEYEAGDDIYNDMSYLVEACEELNFDIDEILQRNIDKLASRAERGVIKGNGDER